jgi:hypothetical protein
MAKKFIIIVLITPFYFLVFWFLLMMLQYVVVSVLPDRLLAPTFSKWPWISGAGAALLTVRMILAIWPKRDFSLPK